MWNGALLDSKWTVLFIIIVFIFLSPILATFIIPVSFIGFICWCIYKMFKIEFVRCFIYSILFFYIPKASYEILLDIGVRNIILGSIFLLLGIFHVYLAYKGFKFFDRQLGEVMNVEIKLGGTPAF